MASEFQSQSNFHRQYESDAPEASEYPPNTFCSHGVMKTEAAIRMAHQRGYRKEMIPPPNTIGRTLGRMTIEFLKPEPAFDYTRLYVWMGVGLAVTFVLGILAERWLHFLPF